MIDRQTLARVADRRLGSGHWMVEKRVEGGPHHETGPLLEIIYYYYYLPNTSNNRYWRDGNTTDARRYYDPSSRCNAMTTTINFTRL